jgi:hypothetical protein
MVATVDEILQIVRSNPFIDGIGYFIEVTTTHAVPEEYLDELTERMQEDFCQHSQATQEGDHVIGFDFHEHILTHGEDGDYFLAAVEALLVEVEVRFGIDHLCIEFQFDLGRAQRARLQVDELLQP